MLKEMTDYFVGEKQESVLFMLAALMALGLAFWLWTQGHRLRLMALPLVVVALMQLVVGVTIFARTDAQLAKLSTQLVSAPAEFKQAETDRMQTVMANFKLYKSVELALLVLGAYLVLGGLYLVVMPLALLWWLKTRWTVMGKIERTLVYGLVFLFFPGLILFAPFFNLRMAGQGEVGG